MLELTDSPGLQAGCYIFYIRAEKIMLTLQTATLKLSEHVIRPPARTHPVFDT